MKLLFCPHCQDVRKLPVKLKAYCDCGKSWGGYTDDINAVYGGDAVMLGFSNPDLHIAIRDNAAQPPKAGMWGHTFDAFVIPESAPSVRREK